MRSSSGAQWSAAWFSSRVTARSAACARRSTTRCPSKGCRRWSTTCRNSSSSMAKYQILTLNHISSQGLHRLPSARYSVGKSAEHPDAILVRSHDMHSMPLGASVRAIGRAGAGTNNIPVAEMSKRGVPVFNAPGANANAVKELVLAALLLAARNVVPALHFAASLDKHATDLDLQVEDAKKQFAGVELPRRTLGILGLGAIGSLVADIAIKLGMNVIGFDPEITVDAAWRLP